MSAISCCQLSFIVCCEKMSSASQCYRYDPYEFTWTECSPLIKARAKFGVAVLKDKIYVCGKCNFWMFLNSRNHHHHHRRRHYHCRHHHHHHHHHRRCHYHCRHHHQQQHRRHNRHHRCYYHFLKHMCSKRLVWFGLVLTISNEVVYLTIKSIFHN